MHEGEGSNDKTFEISTDLSKNEGRVTDHRVREEKMQERLKPLSCTWKPLLRPGKLASKPRKVVSGWKKPLSWWVKEPLRRTLQRYLRRKDLENDKIRGLRNPGLCTARMMTWGEGPPCGWRGCMERRNGQSLRAGFSGVSDMFQSRDISYIDGVDLVNWSFKSVIRV